MFALSLVCSEQTLYADGPNFTRSGVPWQAAIMTV